MSSRAETRGVRRRRPTLRLLAFARPERPRLLLASGLQVLAVGSGLGLMGSAAWLLSAAALQPSIAVLQVAIVGVRAFGLARALLRYGERLAAHDVTLRLLARLRAAFFRSLVPLAPARLRSQRRGDVLARAIEDVQTLEGLFARLLGPSLAALGVAVLVAALLAPFGARLALVAVTGLALGGAFGPGLAARLASAPGRGLIRIRSELTAGLVDGVTGSAELLAFGGETAHVARMVALDRAAVRAQRQVVAASALGTSFATLAADLTAIAVLVFAVPAAQGGRMDGVALAAVTLLTLASFEAVSALPQAWQGLGAIRAACARLAELAATPPAVREPLPDDAAAVSAVSAHVSPTVPAGTPHANTSPLVELRGLRFVYPEATRPALDDVSLILGATGRVAIVGASGSGKSTLLHLLLRFWDVPPGALFLAGRDVRELSSDGVRSRIAFAAQRAHVFTGTLRDNLTLGRPQPKTRVLSDVLTGLRLDALVARLPQGLDAWVGEEGQKLSGGERQRLALARALLREAPLLLLDEPLAQLDALTAHEVMREITRCGRGRATLLVSHSLTGLEEFDELLVLDAGRVVERGAPAELAARGGRYARLLALQRAARVIEDYDSGA
jgi:ATP-binding cassette, subfamily C, bacterial CydC